MFGICSVVSIRGILPSITESGYPLHLGSKELENGAHVTVWLFDN